MQYRLVQRRGRKFEATWNERTMRHGKWRTIQKWVSLGTNDPQEAAEKFKGFVDGEASGKGVAFSRLSEVLQEYTAELLARNTSHHNMKRHHSIVRQLLTHLGDISFTDLTRQDTKQYIRSRGVKPQTASRELDVLSAALNYCVQEELIEWTPFKFYKVGSGVRDRYLTQDEIDQLLDACQSYHLRMWTLIAVSTAARSGAILGLTADRVLFDDNIIDFRDPTIQGRHKPRSVIKMPTGLRPYLMDAIDKSQSGYLVEKNGRPLTSVYNEFRKAVGRAGLEDCSPHVLRHTCAVHMVKAGVPIYEVSSYLGHKNTKITQDHYAKFQPDFMDKSSEVGSSLIANPKMRVIQ